MLTLASQLGRQSHYQQLLEVNCKFRAVMSSRKRASRATTSTSESGSDTESMSEKSRHSSGKDYRAYKQAYRAEWEAKFSEQRPQGMAMSLKSIKEHGFL